MQGPGEGFEIRRIQPSDSIESLTALLHRAFARLGQMGLNYTAVDQPAEVTASRIAAGECYLGIAQGSAVATVVLRHPGTDSGSNWFAKPGVGSAHQLAVDPAVQGRGLGSAMMAFAEHWARSLRYAELAIDTAEPARHLVEFYARRGYRHVEWVQWRGKTYRSTIMSKAL